MTGRAEGEWGGWDPGPAKGPGGLAALILATFARAFAQESDRWFLWLSVVFAGVIVTYFALSDEPDGRVAAALLLAAVGLCLGFRNVPAGLALRPPRVMSRSRRSLFWSSSLNRCSIRASK